MKMLCGGKQIVSSSGYVYVIIEHIDSGSYANVWKAYSVKDRNMVAIKVALEDSEAEIVAEIDNIKKLESDYLPRVLDEIDEPFRGYVMNFMDVSLGDVCGTVLPINTLIKIMYGCLKGLSDMHKNGFLHCDVKPKNILLKSFDCVDDEKMLESLREAESLKKIKEIINDWVFAKQDIDIDDDDISVVSDSSEAGEDSSTEEESESSGNASFDQSMSDNDSIHTKTKGNTSLSHDVLTEKPLLNVENVWISDLGGSVHTENLNKHFIVTPTTFCAPETLLGHAFTNKSDVWSLGCTFYELITGERLLERTCEDVSEKREIVNKIHTHISNIPNETINTSQNKILFFRNDMSLKGCNTAMKPWYETLFENLSRYTNDFKKVIIAKLLINMLCSDQQERISSCGGAKILVTSFGDKIYCQRVLT